MTDRPSKNPPSAAELAGLAAFFQSQADAMIAQYDNINHLLGPTRDWTYPGTLCEVLLRDFLRKYMLDGMSVDKGYFFGRTERGGKSAHCPEIDILIHDERRFRPLFRMGDFVIVQPEAVRAMIQVKRTLSQGPLDKGIGHLIDAKQHLLDVTLAQKVERTPKDPTWAELRPVFTALIGFEEKVKKTDTYRDLLLRHYRRNRPQAYSESDFDTGVYVLPHFVGTVKGVCYSSAGRRIDQKTYWGFRASNPGESVALQVLLSGLMDMFWPESDYLPFGMPPTGFGGILQVPRPDESLHPPFQPFKKSSTESGGVSAPPDVVRAEADVGHTETPPLASSTDEPIADGE